MTESTVKRGHSDPHDPFTCYPHTRRGCGCRPRESMICNPYYDFDVCPDDVGHYPDERDDLKRLLLHIAQDNSPHDAQHMAETWAEREYGSDWWKRGTP